MSLLERWRRWRRWRALRFRRWYGGPAGPVAYLCERLRADTQRRYWRAALERDGATVWPLAGAEVIPFPRSRRGA